MDANLRIVLIFVAIYLGLGLTRLIVGFVRQHINAIISCSLFILLWPFIDDLTEYPRINVFGKEF